MKVLHTSDWHIGNFSGPEIDGENARFLDICKGLDSLVSRAIQENPDVVIISGDVFHQARVWSDRGLRESQTAIQYIDLLSKIAPVCVLRGTPNHDSEEQFNMLHLAFAGNKDVYILDKPEVTKVPCFNKEVVQVAALPSFDKGLYRAKNPGLSKEDENIVFMKLIADMILGLKAQCDSGIPSILTTHFTVTGANTESGQTQLFAKYEPVIEPSTLAAANFDLVCLGHIHRGQKIEGCKNTYYSGAINSLNFNDEGQERGFYIHDITNDFVTLSVASFVNSRFIAVPNREFATIRFDETDVVGINTGELDSVSEKWCGRNKDIKNKIVRILYTCSESANKAFNKTILEQRLYEDGAFWVQEITPEKVTMSVNKEGFAPDNSPEENLKEYLEEKEIEAEKATACIELARSIIAEALESTMTETKTGILVPVEIEVKNYRNYREERFSFNNI